MTEFPLSRNCLFSNHATTIQRHATFLFPFYMSRRYGGGG